MPIITPLFKQQNNQTSTGSTVITPLFKTGTNVPNDPSKVTVFKPTPLKAPVINDVQTNTIKITPDQKKIDLKKIGTNIISKVKEKAPLVIKGLNFALSSSNGQNIAEMSKGFWGEQKAGMEKAGGQNFEPNPTAEFVPKNISQKIGKTWNQLLTDYTVGQWMGINQTLASGTQALGESLAVSKTFAKMQNFVISKFNPAPKITFQDIKDVNAGKASKKIIEDYKKITQNMDKDELMLYVKAAAKDEVNPKLPIRTYVKDSLKKIELKFKDIINPSGKKLLESGKNIENIIQPGEYAPQEIIGKIISGGIENTPESKQIVKLAVEAQNTGQKIVVGKVVLPKSKISVDGIQGIDKIDKYTSASDFANAEYTAKPTDKIGKLDPNIITPRDQIDPNGVTKYVDQIKSGKSIEPIEVVKENGKLVTLEGSHRLTAFQSLNQPVPVIYRGSENIEGLKTIQETFDLSKKNVAQQPVGEQKSPQITAKPKESMGVVSQAQTTIDKPVGEVTGKVSGVAIQIEAKAIEKGLIDKGYSELAQYDSSTIKEQANIASKYSIEDINKIATGEKALPKELKPGTPLSMSEDYAIKNGDIELLRKLSKSPLATQISESASELSLSRMRNSDSPVAVMQDIIKTRQEAYKKRTGKEVNKEVKTEVEKIKKTVKVIDKYDWAKFLDSIEC